MQKEIEKLAPNSSTDQEHGIGSSFDPQSGPTEDALIEQLDGGEGLIRKTPTTPDGKSPNKGLLEENLIEEN